MAEPGIDADTLEAMHRFRSLLGDNWPGWRTGAPLANRFHTTFQGGLPEGVRLVRLLAALEGVPNRDLAIRQGLGSNSWQHFLAAVMALELTPRLNEGGVDVEFIRNESAKCADVLMRPAGRAVVLELKALHNQLEEEDWDALIDLLFDMRHPFAFHDFDIDFEYAALDHPDAVYEGLATMSKVTDTQWHALPKSVGRARRRIGELASYRLPFVQKPPVERIILKLKSWCNQLRDLRNPTLIVVQAPNAFEFSRTEQLFLQTHHLEQCLRTALASKRMISGVLVYEKPFLPPLERRLYRVGSSGLMTGAADGFGVIGALVLNPVARVPLTKCELQPVINAIVGSAANTHPHAA